MANVFKEPDLSTERGKHLNWCKQRAFEYLDKGDITNAWASFVSDMMKHEETQNHIALNPIMAMMYMGSVSQMREYLNGFN